MSVVADGQTSRNAVGPTTAQRRREQTKRAEARHIAWLLGRFQAGATHHTAVPKAGLLAEVDNLKVLVKELQKEVELLRAQIATQPVEK